MNETISQTDVVQDRSRHGTAEAARLAEELRLEQERSNQAERQRKILESQIKVFKSF